MAFAAHWRWTIWQGAIEESRKPERYCGGIRDALEAENGFIWSRAICEINHAHVLLLVRGLMVVISVTRFVSTRMIAITNRTRRMLTLQMMHLFAFALCCHLTYTTASMSSESQMEYAWRPSLAVPQAGGHIAALGLLHGDMAKTVRSRMRSHASGTRARGSSLIHAFGCIAARTLALQDLALAPDSLTVANARCCIGHMC